ncbi:MAG: GatB/YqeY domain-containing protein [Candidatus Limnocylindrales bacterium]
MSLRERLQTDITAAMRGGDSLRRDVLRMAANSAYNLEKRNQKPLTEDEFLGVLSREVKTRRESVDAYTKAGRADLADREQAEIDILADYLPAALTSAEIESLVEQAITQTGAASARDLGKVMGWLSPRTRGRADGQAVSGLVAARLARADIAAHDGAAPAPATGGGAAENPAARKLAAGDGGRH